MALVRELTEDEITSFQERGWAHLPGLVGRSAVTDLLAKAELRLALNRNSDTNPVIDHAFGQDRDFAESDESFRALARGGDLGRAACRLLGAQAVRLQITNLLVKEPEGSGRHDAPTVYHQDFPWMPMDRSALLTFWVALAPVSAHMGSLRFRDGSHRRGMLGRSFVRAGDDLPSVHPWLEELDLVGGFDMEPGDATVHHGLTVHGAPKNTGRSTRLSFAATYFDATTLYTGAPYGQTDALEPALKVNQPFDHPRFPMLSSTR
jgi:hypothetical protein